MMLRNAIGSLALAAVTAIIIPSAAAAQSGMAAVGSYGSTAYDLEGVDTESVDTEEIWSARLRIGFDALALEGGVAFSDYRVEGGDEVDLVIPELQLQIGYPFWRVRPYAGAGVGFVLIDPSASGADSSTDFGLNSAVGIDLAILESVGLNGELRLRGLDSFNWSMVDYTLGLVIAF